MTLKELLTYIGQHTSFQYLVDGDTLSIARRGQHPNPLIGQLICAIADKCQCQNIDCTVSRETVVNAFGPIRLKYMADDAPVEGFRLIEKTIITVDAAFNEEALRSK